MATGYTRQDIANEIADGEFISSDPLDAEFDGIESAFNASTGHAHDGTLGNGGPITRVGPIQDLIISATQVLPKTTNTLDLGSGTFKFKDAYFDGVVNSDSFVGPLTGAVTGNASTATALETARTIAISGQIIGTATSFDGTGNISIAVDTLSASNLNAGTIASARVAGSYTGITGVGTLAAGNIASGFGNINIATNTFTGNGSGITAINASNISTGTLAAARLPNHSADLLTSGTVSNARLPTAISVSTVTASGAIEGVEFRASDNGTVTNPRFVFSSDTNTGWFCDPGVSWTWALNGTARLKFDATGITALVSGDGFTGTGAGLDDLNASELTSGTVPSGRLSGSYTGITGVGALGAGSIGSSFGNINIGSSTFTGNGSGLNSLNASQLDTGTVPVARFGTSTSYRDWVLDRTSEAGAGVIGTYNLLLGPAGGQTAGTNYAGSNLRTPIFHVNSVDNDLDVTFSSGPSGTWKAMDTISAGDPDDRALSLFLRVS